MENNGTLDASNRAFELKKKATIEQIDLCIKEVEKLFSTKKGFVSFTIYRQMLITQALNRLKSLKGIVEASDV